MTNKDRRVYTEEFKRETVALVESSGKNFSEVERELGLKGGIVGKWVRQAKAEDADAFPGHGQLKPADERIRELEYRLLVAEQERDILK